MLRRAGRSRTNDRWNRVDRACRSTSSVGLQPRELRLGLGPNVFCLSSVNFISRVSDHNALGQGP